MPFSEDRQAVHLANDTAYGLSASVWSKDLGAAGAMASEIAAGTVMINECVYTHALPGVPWGGVKQSGFGRTHGGLGLLEFTSPTHEHTCRDTREDSWWYGYDLHLLETSTELVRGVGRGFASRLRSIPLLWRLRRRSPS